MKRKFICFADSRMMSSLKRLHNQAEQMQFFDEISTLSELDLPDDFRVKHAKLMKRGVRGFGYWVWKPYIIQKALEALNDGDELWYLDTGCHLNPKGRDRLFHYAEVLANTPLGIAAFELETACSDRAYTKMDLLVHMGVHDKPEITDSGQLCTTHILMRKCPPVMQFVEDWKSAWNDMHLVDDTPSLIPNFPEFIEHRHDQSVFSIMAKLRGAAKLSGTETWPGASRDWSKLQNFPFWDKRDLGFSAHTIARFFRKIKRIWHMSRMKKFQK